MINKPDSYKKLIFIHSFLSIALSVLFFFFSGPEFAKAFLASSFLMNIYLRLLSLNMGAFVLTINKLGQEIKTGHSLDNSESKDGQKSNYSIFLLIFSWFRMALIALGFAIFILKFSFNLYALASGFLLFQVILIGSGIFLNASYKRGDFR